MIQNRIKKWGGGVTLSTNYILTSDGELFHYGVKGMKWGVRRYQNKDGSLTPVGKKRIADRAGRYMEPDATFGSKGRRDAASKYKADTVNGETLELAERYLYRYSNATLKDLGLSESVAARRYVEDYFRNDPKMKALSAIRDATDAQRDTEAKAKISKMSPSNKKLAKQIVDGFHIDEYGRHVSTFKKDIYGNTVEFDIESRSGTKNSAAVSAIDFLKRYDLGKAKEGVAKMYYDESWAWHKQDPDDPANPSSRDDFKRRIKPEYVHIRSDDNTYEVSWDEDGMYGRHILTDEGFLRDMKVRYRHMDG